MHEAITSFFIADNGLVGDKDTEKYSKRTMSPHKGCQVKPADFHF
jgi:hypothetical protein